MYTTTLSLKRNLKKDIEEDVDMGISCGLAHLGTADSSVKFSESGYHEMGRDLTSRGVKPVREFYHPLEVISLDEYR